MSVRIGYACISMIKRREGIYTGRTITLQNIKKHPEKVKQLAIQNIKDLIEIIKYNESIGIRFYRITSNLFPHLENPKIKAYSIDFAESLLADVGELARNLGHRLTMHPGQFVQLGSPRSEVVKQSVRDLNAHARIFLAMGLKPELGTVMIIHLGGTFGDKIATMDRWAENFNKLPEETRQFIALENDEWSYSVNDLLPLCEKNRIPLCIDFFHHQIGHSDLFNIYDHGVVQRVMNTWKLRGIKPKCHWSNQAEGMRKGSHGKCVENIPRELLNLCRQCDCDIMLEAKDKDICAIEILKKYFNCINNNGRIEWQLI